MRYRLIACEVLLREFCHVVASSPHLIDVEFAVKGLHDLESGQMRDRLQAMVDAVDSDRYDAVLLGYALCNNGVAGLQARTLPLVMPRAHDCITLFMGDKERYLRYFHDNPGVYFHTMGWLERGAYAGELSQLSVQRQVGMDRSYQELVDKYGEENARYLYDMLCETTRNYSKAAYIEMGIEPDARFEEQSAADARSRGWQFEKVPGDLGLFRDLVNGNWGDGRFLVVQPGCKIVARFDEAIVGAVPASPD